MIHATARPNISWVDLQQRRTRQRQSSQRYQQARSYLRACTRANITIEEYRAKLSSQDGKCAICGIEPLADDGKLTLFLDHDHKRQRARGFLCNGCNTAIGMFREDRDAMRQAILYLEDWANTFESTDVYQTCPLTINP